MRTLFLYALVLAAAGAPAAAQQPSVPPVTGKAVAQPDPFGDSTSCLLADSRMPRALTPDEAMSLLLPCFKDIRRTILHRSGIWKAQRLRSSVALESLGFADGAIEIAATYCFQEDGAAVERIFREAVQRRGGRILGHPLTVKILGKMDGHGCY